MEAGAAVIPDTNILLHFKQLQDLDWKSLVSPSITAIVIPMIVVDELDKHKDGSDRWLAERARKALSNIEVHVDRNIRPGILLKIDDEPEGHSRAPIPDDEIIARGATVGEGFAEGSYLVSNDTGMRLRATRMYPADRVCRLPEALRVERSDPQGEEIKRLRKELLEIQNTKPQIKVSFAGRPFLAPAPVSPLTPVVPVAKSVAAKAEEIPPLEYRRRAETPIEMAMENLVAYSLVSDSQVDDYNEKRTRWLREWGAWLERRTLLWIWGQYSIQLPITLTTTGTVTPNDLEMRLKLQSAEPLRLVTAHDLDLRQLGEEPKPPKVPVPAGLGVIDLPNLGLYRGDDYKIPSPTRARSRPWNVGEDGVASARVAELRPDGRDFLVPGTLLIAREDTEIWTTGVQLTWELYSTAPALRDEGVLNVRPRELGSPRKIRVREHRD